MRALLDGFVPGLPEPAIAAILARADGMPLYAVETVRTLVADGRLVRDGDAYRPIGELGELAIPDTLRSLIASRLDALDPADRSLVADASVLGQSFSVAGLTAVSGQASDVLEPRLKALVRRELFDVEVDPRSPERGQYRFVQSLIREVAYGTLAKRERRTRHLAAARYFEALGDDELAGALASHYVAAHEASAEGAEADAVAIQARLALSGAAERAATLGAHEQAVSYLRQAIAITADPGERAALHLRAAASANAAAIHDDAEALVREGIDLARAAGDQGGVGAGEALLGEILIDAAQPKEAVEVLEAAIAAFPETGSGEVRATLLANLSRAFMRSNLSVKSVAAADLALDLAEHLGLDRIVAETFNNKGSALSFSGRRRESLALIQAAVDLAHAGGFVAAEVRAMNNLAASFEDLRQVRDQYRAAADLARRVGNRNMARWTMASARFGSYVLADDWDAALAEAADDVADGQGSPLDEIRTISLSAVMHIARGESTDAIMARLEVLSGEISAPYATSAVHSLRSDRAWLAGDYPLAYDEAMVAAQDEQISMFYYFDALRAAIWERDLARAREVTRKMDEHPDTGAGVSADRSAGHAAVAALEGRHEDAIAGYRAAMAAYRSIGAELWIARTVLNFATVMDVDHPAVREAAAEARPIFERVRARAYLERLDAALARTAGSGSSSASSPRQAPYPPHEVDPAMTDHDRRPDARPPAPPHGLGERGGHRRHWPASATMPSPSRRRGTSGPSRGSSSISWVRPAATPLASRACLAPSGSRHPRRLPSSPGWPRPAPPMTPGSAPRPACPMGRWSTGTRTGRSAGPGRRSSARRSTTRPSTGPRSVTPCPRTGSTPWISTSSTSGRTATREGLGA